jgi:hypothetical protein
MIRIEWRHEAGDGHVGRVGGMALFAIHRPNVSLRRTVQLETRLPIPVSPDMRWAESQAEAESNAEIILAAFLHRIGAQWNNR